MSATAHEQPATLRFLFDPACPWTWRTSQWIREARRSTPIDVEWGLYSLEYVNRENTDNPYLPMLRRNRLAIRLLELARRQGGNEAIDRLYAALGTARHERDEDLGERSVLQAALAQASLSEELLAQAEAQPEIDEELNRHYAAATEEGAFATPTLIIDGAKPLYGPVIDTVPSGEDAVTMWNDVRQLASRPYFYELKRQR